MKEKILAALKTKFQGLNDAILNRQAEKLAKTITSEEGIAAGVEAVTLQLLFDSYADSRATEAQQTAIKNYETKYKLKDGKPTEDVPPTKQDPPKDGDGTKDGDAPAWAKALMEANKALQEEISAMKGVSTKKSRSEVLSSALKDVPDSVRNSYMKNFERMSFKDDEEFNSFVEEVKTDTASITSEFAAKGAVITPPKGGNGAGNDKTASKEETDAVLNRIL